MLTGNDDSGAMVTWQSLSLTERRRLAAKYLAVETADVDPDGLAQTEAWFATISEAGQRLNLMNCFFALGGGDNADRTRRGMWDQVARLIPGEWNSQIGLASLLVELRDAERFKRAGITAGLKEDYAFVRNRYHRGASFSLREWRVRASLNVANDTAAAIAVGFDEGGGRIARAEIDAWGPTFGLLGLWRHKFGKIDPQIVRLAMTERGLIPESGALAPNRDDEGIA
ncbi:MAG TPA: hypothetical protein VFD58_24245 [Blastocatellia bacterium]|nr:hypothetical protein [Blastocatellia bacterium]